MKAMKGTVMSDDAIAIFTGKSVETILQDGGTQSWVLDRGNARHCRYAVLCRNTHAEWSEGDEPHGAAFMVGRIGDVVPSTEVPDRWKILFSDYALVNIPDVWGGWRNPVRYTKMGKLGIEADSLAFSPMPEPQAIEPVGEQRAASPQAAPLTIADAKRALAETFGVSPDAVEITIRG
jgi:hypothetical protein